MGLVNNAGVNDSVGLENGSYKGFINSINKNLNTLLFNGALCTS